MGSKSITTESMYESPRKIFVGVENGHDEVNIQISVKINMNVFTKVFFGNITFTKKFCGEILR